MSSTAYRVLFLIFLSEFAQFHLLVLENHWKTFLKGFERNQCGYLKICYMKDKTR
ncbi:hypothetical protein TPHV1_90076 [Treponema phagedenis]|uniref:Uncharacterized protein n=1 Tax=Treponema phagedenis TaxID=162 RepID=A0A0B7H0N9_TREPH|nr:hypothetical protein TPHV1_90076 [Treponema phagedenis]